MKQARDLNNAMKHLHAWGSMWTASVGCRYDNGGEVEEGVGRSDVTDRYLGLPRVAIDGTTARKQRDLWHPQQRPYRVVRVGLGMPSRRGYQRTSGCTGRDKIEAAAQVTFTYTGENIVESKFSS